MPGPAVPRFLRRRHGSTRRAYQRIPRAGALTTPVVTTPSISTARSVRHPGRPATKPFVPSTGSMNQRRAPVPVVTNSSPTTTSSGHARARRMRRSRSMFRSASVTGDPSGLCRTSSPVRRKYRVAISAAASAASARDCANARSSPTARRGASGFTGSASRAEARLAGPRLAGRPSGRGDQPPAPLACRIA